MLSALLAVAPKLCHVGLAIRRNAPMLPLGATPLPNASSPGAAKPLPTGGGKSRVDRSTSAKNRLVARRALLATPLASPGATMVRRDVEAGTTLRETVPPCLRDRGLGKDQRGVGCAQESQGRRVSCHRDPATACVAQRLAGQRADRQIALDNEELPTGPGIAG